MVLKKHLYTCTGYQPPCPPPSTPSPAPPPTSPPCSRSQGYLIAALSTSGTHQKGYQPPACPPPARSTTEPPCVRRSGGRSPPPGVTTEDNKPQLRHYVGLQEGQFRLPPRYSLGTRRTYPGIIPSLFLETTSTSSRTTLEHGEIQLAFWDLNWSGV